MIINKSRLLIKITAIVLVFLLGAVWSHYKLPPFAAIKKIFIQVTMTLSRDAPTTNPKSVSKSFFETTLLPFTKTHFKVTDESEPKKYGGLCATSDGIIIVNWRGEFTHFDPIKETFSILQIELPNNLELAAADYPNRQKVHDIACKTSLKAEDTDLFVSYDTDSGSGKRMVVAKMTSTKLGAQKRKSSPWRIIFQTEEWNDLNRPNLSGRLLLLDSGDLLIGVSQNPWPADRSQKVDSSAGKVFLLHHALDWAAELFSLGHRNIAGLLESKTGRIFSTEHGLNGGDELNRLEPGQNYGWPLATHGAPYTSYSSEVGFSNGRHSNASFNSPIFSWLPSIAVSNLIELDGFHPMWDGDYLVSTLKGRSLHRLRLNEGRVVYDEAVYIAERIRDILQFKNSIYLYTDQAELVRLTIDEARLTKNQRSDSTSALKNELLAENCAQCHHFSDTNPNHSAPSLAGILGRNIASDSFRHYSKALRKKNNLKWTRSNLKQFIASPQKFCPGSSMPKIVMSDEEMENLLDVLADL
jgi:glucose/arabinose dehydrogenase